MWFQDRRINQWCLQNGLSRESIQQMVVLKCSKQYLSHEDSLRRKGLIIRGFCTNSEIHFNQNYPFLGSQDEMEDTSNGRKKTILNGVIEEEVYIEQPP